MRTLKVLSLVLALVLCFGLVGTAFAANTDKYTDADKIGDVYNEAVEVLIGAGIVDPAKVTRSALQNAASIASTLLTTESIVTDIPEPVQPMPQGGQGMGGMVDDGVPHGPAVVDAVQRRMGARHRGAGEEEHRHLRPRQAADAERRVHRDAGTGRMMPYREDCP